MTLPKGARKSKNGAESKSINTKVYLDLSVFWLKTVEYQDMSPQPYFQHVLLYTQLNFALIPCDLETGIMWHFSAETIQGTGCRL